MLGIAAVSGRILDLKQSKSREGFVSSNRTEARPKESLTRFCLEGASNVFQARRRVSGCIAGNGRMPKPGRSGMPTNAPVVVRKGHPRLKSIGCLSLGSSNRVASVSHSCYNDP